MGRGNVVGGKSLDNLNLKAVQHYKVQGYMDISYPYYQRSH
jgi:hypothetical protein